MTRNKVAGIWNVYFFCGFFILIIHYLRYFNSFITGHIPWADTNGDYEYLTLRGLIFRFFLILISIFILKKRNDNLVLFTNIVWGLSLFLLSNEHDKYTFLGTLLIFLITFYQAIWGNLKRSKTND